uniref:Defensin-like protein 1 n=1 Tax=Heuchera sanguinea TaxID=43368 RepID=DEF1_HEUSA|nr:RecName: Full=Defensin-like protein 1; AltName: Full=Cysteine-rich antifungal protein 1; AltName: Full=Defensin AFP1; Short=HsAFP1 [Heuchera sanguinea]AAB34974.1 defensin Hs-AFP1=cysteine-rich antifungal protein [Heuchera sanguinea, seeds, Peptide, 54 aa] [Heuchera sanguinea]2N2Q_A Chain A, Defensin-like protein 1 [Heuchera sanguinea]
DGVKLCDVPSGTWSGHCGSSSKCSQQCKDREHFAYGGACHYQFPSVKCFCKRQC